MIPVDLLIHLPRPARSHAIRSALRQALAGRRIELASKDPLRHIRIAEYEKQITALRPLNGPVDWDWQPPLVGPSVASPITSPLQGVWIETHPESQRGKGREWYVDVQVHFGEREQFCFGRRCWSEGAALRFVARWAAVGLEIVGAGRMVALRPEQVEMFT